MSQVVLRYLKFAFVLLCLSVLSACGSDNDGTCSNSTDCKTNGETCVDGQCVIEVLECTNDEECLGHQQCSSNNTCINRTSCSINEHCIAGKVCQNSACVDQQCEDDNQCARGSACQNSVCVELTRQCSAVGQSCSEDRLAREGFACVDLEDGKGFTCQAACTGGAGVNKCATGSICIDRTYCKPSECAGPAEGQAFCDAKAAANPADFPNGASCAPQRDQYGNTANLCVPAGTVELGEECTNRNPCKAGLLCVPGITAVNSLSSALPIAFCAEPCTNNGHCSQEGESCIGAAERTFSGGGICGDRCQPFKAGEETCSDNRSCIPVSNTDGICTLEADNTVEIYSKCTEGSETSECPSGTWCFGVTEGEARCLPLCNPSLSSQNLQNATCPTAQPASFARTAHMAEGVGALDISLGATPLAEGLGFGALADETEFARLAVGTADLTVRLAGSEDVIYTQSVTLRGNEALNFVVVKDEESTEDVKIKVLQVDEPRKAPVAEGETTELRVVHTISDLTADSLDVVLVRSGEDVNEAANRQRLATAAAYGAPSDFAAIESNQLEGVTGDVTYDVYLFKAAASLDFAKIEGLTVTTGDVATLYLVGTQAAPGLEVVAHSVAATARILGGYCYDLTQGRSPTPGLGICFENCTDNTHIGGGVCSGGGVNACNPSSPEQMWCFPSGQSEIGGACSESSDCVDGLFCDQDGAGSGTCRSYCEHKTPSINPSLACQEDEICVPKRGFSNLGECRIGCQSGAGYEDDNCPESQKSCFGADGISYCQGSGTDKLGERCADPSVQSCEPGSVCAKNVPTFAGMLVEPFTPLAQGEEAYCRALCKPFLGPGESSGCGEGFACSPILPGTIHSPNLGHCVESGPFRASNTACGGNELGKMCGDNAFCVENICLRFCEADSGDGCWEGETCRSWNQDSGPLFGVLNRCN